MGKNMEIGKQQLIFTYLPGKIFDYSKKYITAKLISVRGSQVTDINQELILKKINEYVKNWDENFRPSLTDTILSKRQDRFILINPKKADSEMFPLVFHCSNSTCNRIINCSESGRLPDKNLCPFCHQGRLNQLNWVKIHRCGAIKPLTPPFECPKCHHKYDWALDTRGSSVIQNFIWICKNCNTSQSVRAGNCRECTWTTQLQGIEHPGLMDVATVRANSAFYAHYVILLNLPKRDLEGFLSLPDWQELAAAFYFELPEIKGRNLSDLNQQKDSKSLDIEGLKKIGISPTPEQIRQYQQNQAVDTTRITRTLREKTGLSQEIWINSGQEMLESILCRRKTSKSIDNSDNKIEKLGLLDLTLVTDFPYITSTFGYSRQDYRPNYCRINPFPNDAEFDGKHPIFFDTTLADAIIFRLNPSRVYSWLEKIGFHPGLSKGTDSELIRKAYYCKLFDGINCQNTIDQNNPEARVVFGLLHTFSHMCVRQAALLAGLEVTSLTEYILPRSLTFALYGNQRFSSSIGAMVSLYEDSLGTWLDNITSSNRCVYDPVCLDHGGSCHACIHLAETSCRFFNQNLSRAFLFGGYDSVLNTNISGFFEE